MLSQCVCVPKTAWPLEPMAPYNERGGIGEGGGWSNGRQGRSSWDNCDEMGGGRYKDFARTPQCADHVSSLEALSATNATGTRSRFDNKALLNGQRRASQQKSCSRPRPRARLRPGPDLWGKRASTKTRSLR